MLVRSLLLMAGVIVLFAQPLVAQDKAADAPDYATVYLYRYDHDPFIYSFIFTRKLSVKFSPAAGAPKELPEIASLKNKRYLILKLAPGRYVFDTRMMPDKLGLDLAAGEERYLRWDHGYRCPTEEPNLTPPCEDRPAAIYEMPADKARLELAKVKPIGKGDVKNRSLVIIPPK